MITLNILNLRTSECKLIFSPKLGLKEFFKVIKLWFETGFSEGVKTEGGVGESQY